MDRALEVGVGRALGGPSREEPQGQECSCRRNHPGARTASWHDSTGKSAVFFGAAS